MPVGGRTVSIVVMGSLAVRSSVADRCSDGKPDSRRPVQDLYRGCRTRLASAMGAPVPPVLPGREGHGAARRAVDAARGPRAAVRQPSSSTTCAAGVPRMSPTLLSRAAASSWSRAGIVDGATRQTSRYVLTPAGEELRPVVEALGAVGHALDRRARRRGPRPQAADVGHAPQRRPRRRARPAGRCVRFTLPRRRPRRAQLVGRDRPRRGRRVRRSTPGTR